MSRTVVAAPGTVSIDTSEGSVTWSDPEGATEDGGDAASALLDPGDETYWLIASNFGLALPSTAVIEGFEINYDTQASAISAVRETGVRMQKGGVLSGLTRTLGLVLWGIGAVLRTAGGPSDTFGVQWTYNDTNAVNFGVGIQVENIGLLPASAMIDSIELTVTYDTPILGGMGAVG